MRLAPKFSAKYSSSVVQIDENKTVLTGGPGYRSALATSLRPARSFYYEAQIENDSGYARIGIATLDYDTHGPVGIDECGYSYGSRNGYGFHKSRRVRFGERFTKRDILSVYLRRTRRGITLSFFVNGIRQLKSFDKISEEDIFWPAASLYGNCTTSFNFGPYFAYEDKIKLELKHDPQEN